MRERSISSLGISYINGNITEVKEYIDSTGSPRIIMAYVANYILDCYPSELPLFIKRMTA